MTDNFDLFREYIKKAGIPDSKNYLNDKFFLVELIRRGKDCPNLPAANYTFKIYYVDSIEEYDRANQAVQTLALKLQAAGDFGSLRESDLTSSAEKAIYTSMKKIFLTLVALMAVTFCSAETKVDNVDTRFDMSCDMNRLSAVLDLNEWQMEAVEVIQNNFNNEIQSLATVRGPQRRHMVHQVVRKDAQKMKQILNDKQFDTYMRLLVTTLRNKHL